MQIYQAQSDVNIRREPRITSFNVMGRINAGTQREVFETVTNKDNSTWGRISQPDSAGVSLWVCISNINRVFMRPIETQQPAPAGLEARVVALEARVAALESK